MRSRTRREFLNLLGSSIVFSGASKDQLFASNLTPTTSHVLGWTTSKDQRFRPIDQFNSGTRGISTLEEVRIDPSVRQQKILGFGAAFTDSSCYLVHSLEKHTREEFLSETFGETGLRLSIGRTTIGSSDYSISAYSYDDSLEPDPDLAHFTIDHDQAYILPTLQEAGRFCPDLFLLSTPWSPPGWMKSGGSIFGGSMRKVYFHSYADYFLKFLQSYLAAGVKINAVTAQNEPDTDQNGRMPATLWGQEYEIEFIKDHLGPALANAKLNTEIWLLDHNYNLWGRVVDELSDSDLFNYVDGVAWHNYGGTPEAMTRVHNAFPTKHQYWTEGGPDITSIDYSSDWTKWSRTFTEALRNWSRCIVAWNLLLDERGLPKIGPFSCGGLLTVNSKNGKISRSGQYWAMAHYSKLVRRGATVIRSIGNLEDVEHVAFENPDGTYVLVITNSATLERRIRCTLGSQSFLLSLDADSVTTLLWGKA